MAGGKCVVRAFTDAGEASNTPMLTQGVELIAASGQQFMCICLVSDIPDDPVLRGVKHVVKCNGKLDHSQAGTKMTWICGNNINNELS